MIDLNRNEPFIKPFLVVDERMTEDELLMETLDRIYLNRKLGIYKGNLKTPNEFYHTIAVDLPLLTLQQAMTPINLDRLLTANLRLSNFGHEVFLEYGSHTPFDTGFMKSLVDRYTELTNTNEIELTARTVADVETTLSKEDNVDMTELRPRIKQMKNGHIVVVGNRGLDALIVKERDILISFSTLVGEYLVKHAFSELNNLPNRFFALDSYKDMLLYRD